MVECFTPKIERFSGAITWIDLSFVERSRTQRWAIYEAIRCHLSGMSLRDVSNHLEECGIDRSHVAVHNWVHAADLTPASTVTTLQLAVDEKPIRVNGHDYWLYAAVDPATNHLLHVQLFHTRTTQLTIGVLRELQQKHDLDQITFLIDDAHHLKAALARLGLRFQVTRHGNRNAVKHVFREIKRRTPSFSNTLSHAAITTAESWLQAFAVWYNRCQS